MSHSKKHAAQNPGPAADQPEQANGPPSGMDGQLADDTDPVDALSEGATLRGTIRPETLRGPGAVDDEVPDLPDLDETELPDDLRGVLETVRRDPTEPTPAEVLRQVRGVRVAYPGKDDLFRCYPKPAGWVEVFLLDIKKGFDKSSRTKTIVVGKKALANPAVAERAVKGFAALTVTAEGVLGVLVLRVPDQVNAENTYPWDKVKWDAAQASKRGWTRQWYDDAKGIHDFRVEDLTGEPNNKPKWPAEHPKVLVLRALAAAMIDDPNHMYFKNLFSKGPAC
jgi:hypothetical protein